MITKKEISKDVVSIGTKVRAQGRGREQDVRVPHRRLGRGESRREQALERVAGRQGDHRPQEGRRRSRSPRRAASSSSRSWRSRRRSAARRWSERFTRAGSTGRRPRAGRGACAAPRLHRHRASLLGLLAGAGHCGALLLELARHHDREDACERRASTRRRGEVRGVAIWSTPRPDRSTLARREALELALRYGAGAALRLLPRRTRTSLLGPAAAATAVAVADPRASSASTRARASAAAIGRRRLPSGAPGGRAGRRSLPAAPRSPHAPPRRRAATRHASRLLVARTRSAPACSSAGRSGADAPRRLAADDRRRRGFPTATRSLRSAPRPSRSRPAPSAETKRRLAGRVMARRDMGKLVFLDLVDRSGRIQLLVPASSARARSTSTSATSSASSASPAKSRRGEPSLLVDELEVLARIRTPLPDTFHGLTDVEQRYRRRYLDLLMNEESRRDACSARAWSPRSARYLDERGLRRGRDAGAPAALRRRVRASRS